MTKDENENNSPSESTFTAYIQTPYGMAFLGLFGLVLAVVPWIAFNSYNNNDTTSSAFEGVSSGFLDVTEAQVKAVGVVDNEVSEEITVTASPINPTVITTD